jgi:transcriptional regulator with XRE-family HTH domain
MPVVVGTPGEHEREMDRSSSWTRSARGRGTDLVDSAPALGQLIYGLRTEAGLSQRELGGAGTTQSVISRLKEGGGARNRIDTLARVTTALDRHLVVSFPVKLPASAGPPSAAGLEAAIGVGCLTKRLTNSPAFAGRNATGWTHWHANHLLNVPRWTHWHALDGILIAHNPKVAGSNPAPATK